MNKVFVCVGCHDKEPKLICNEDGDVIGYYCYKCRKYYTVLFETFARISKGKEMKYLIEIEKCNYERKKEK